MQLGLGLAKNPQSWEKFLPFHLLAGPLKLYSKGKEEYFQLVQFAKNYFSELNHYMPYDFQIAVKLPTHILSKLRRSYE